ncbi:MAG: alpha-L-fucosidase [Chitinophagaceae bacterium]
MRIDLPLPRLRHLCFIFIAFVCLLSITSLHAQEKDTRMQWWRDARFGLFIHWGLYSIPAGEWNGQTNYGEWIRNNAKIPLETYDKFVTQFNPTKFDAKEWVKMAKDAGMKYIVITTKHHDGFGMFDSKFTDFDIMSTPFQRDVLKELAAVCEKEGIQLCFYHSIMDWHHPDYLPRRIWETDRSATGTDFDRYVVYMKNQLRELLTNYGKIGLLWFDGEWENTWNHQRGKDLYNYVRSLQPQIIVNNRVDVGRDGMEGSTKAGEYVGDYGTPEQEIPATGIPGTDWESCMTMNNNWGYNSHDNNWKSAQELVRNLIDIASKGGNFLLNVGPTAEGLFPQASIDRLKAIGSWMKTNNEAIYGTSPSPFKKLDWGRCTQKNVDGSTKLYLHIFDWPANNQLVIPGLGNTILKAYALDNKKKGLKITQQDANYIIDISGVKQHDYATVIALDINGAPIVYTEPVIKADEQIFTDQLVVKIATDASNALVYYTTDGTEPTINSTVAKSPLVLQQTTTVKATSFVSNKPVSSTSIARFEKVTPPPGKTIAATKPGLQFASYKGKWTALPDFSSLTPDARGQVGNFDIRSKQGQEEYGFVFEGLLNIPADGIYTFYLSSDDGSRLLIDDAIAVDHDGLHGMTEKYKSLPLGKGYHTIKLQFFENSGSDDLKLYWKGPGFDKSVVPDNVLFRAGN